MKKVTVLVFGLTLAACATRSVGEQTSSGGEQTSRGGEQTSGGPAASGESVTPPPVSAPTDAEATYSGVYEVPVTPELAAAATYETDEIHWTVLNGIARLTYDLPKGLVGNSIRVDFTGPFDTVTNTGTLTGPPGTAKCSATGTVIVCTEAMRGLLPIEADMARVERLAKTEYAGPVQDRIAVTERFIGDPIGIVRFDSSVGTVEPSGKHKKD